MNTGELLLDTFGRIAELVPQVVDALDLPELTARPGGHGNSICWLVWHLSRVQDDHLATAAGTGQVWTEQDWSQRFGLALPVADTGYGHRSADVDAVRASAELLCGYHAAVAGRTERYLGELHDADLDRVVDAGFTPAVTLGVRLVSVASDCLQHIGQAAYARGLPGRRPPG